MRVREWGRGGRGTRARESIRRRLSGGRRICTVTATTCPAPRDGGRVCSASRSGDPCCIGDIQCLAWSGDTSAGSTPADVWGGLGWVVRLGLLLSLSLFCCAASDGLFTTTHFSPRMPCMSLHRGWGGAVRGQTHHLLARPLALSSSPCAQYLRQGHRRGVRGTGGCRVS